MTIPRRLLRWFDEHQRPLPWRHSRDPYRVWISEVMLQQTTVAAVIPYFERWMRTFPTVQSLAKAPLSKVLKHWEGLGYYSRARNLHAAAKIIVRDHDGVFPKDVDAAFALPGVGRYILGAVLSQAYEVRLPIVEANSVRVLARLFAYGGDPRKGRWAWDTAESLLPRKRIGDYNQALMELGATVCKPKNPACSSCPLKKDCLAFQRGLQETIPPPKQQPAMMKVNRTAFVFRKGDAVLIQQRADKLWEFPIDVDATIVRQLVVAKHTVMRSEITLTAVEAKGEIEGKWVAVKSLAKYPMGVAHRKIAVHLISPQRKQG